MKEMTKTPLKQEDAPALLTVGETCQHLRISRWMFYRLIQRRELASVRIGRRRLVPESAIRSYIEKHLEAVR